MRLNGNLKLEAMGASEVQNFVFERLETLPTFYAEEIGRAVFIISDEVEGLYINDGTQWQLLATGGSTADIQAELDALEASVGALVKADGTFDAAALAAFTNVDTTGVTTITQLLTKIDGHFAQLKSAFNELTDVSVASRADKDIVQYNATAQKWENKSLSGAGVQAHDTDLDAIAALTTTGYIVRTSDGTAATRAITAAPEMTVENGDGVAGATVLGLADSGVTAGQYSKVTVDVKGRVTAAEHLANADIVAALGFTPVNKAGDTMGGTLVLHADPVAAMDAANKHYVDAVAAGLSWKDPVIDVVADIAARDALTGVKTGDRVIVLADDKIYTKTADAWDAGYTPADGDACFNKKDEMGFVFSGTDWVQFTGGGQTVAGVGLKKTGNRLDIDLGAGVTANPDETGEASKLIVDVGNGLDLDAANDLDKVKVKADAEGSIAVTAAGVKVAAKGVKAAHLGADVAGHGLEGGDGAAIAVKAADTTITVDATGIKANVGKAAGSVAAGDHVHAAAEVTFVPTAEIKSANVQTAIAKIGESVKGSYFLYSADTAATQHVVTHNIGSKYCNVTVIDDTDEQIIPQSVTFNSDERLTVVVNTAVKIKVVVMGQFVPAL